MFRDRVHAGKQLAEAVRDRLRGDEEAVVLGLARGGVIVAREVARALNRPLDVVVVRKIGAPGNEELAIGAVAEDGRPILNDALVESYGIAPDYLARAVGEARKVIRQRTQEYRPAAAPDVRGKTAVLVDDGIATGYTMEAAIATVRAWGAARIVVTVPVAAPDTLRRFEGLADETVVLSLPPFFFAVGEFYERFPQVSDDEVKAALRGTTVAVS